MRLEGGNHDTQNTLLASVPATVGSHMKWIKLAAITLIESIILVAVGIGPLLVHLWFSDRF